MDRYIIDELQQTQKKNTKFLSPIKGLDVLDNLTNRRGYRIKFIVSMN